jgi:two-component system, chemotaxis family, CheB/CheR fusion protein
MADQESTQPDDPRQLDQRAGAEQAGNAEVEEDTTESHSQLDFPVVGVGASAGGLEAFEALLRRLPPDTGMAMIFVQHLSPEHASNLTEILSRSTKMPVREAADGVRIERNHVYVIPPDRDLAVMHGELQLMRRPEASARHMPIDYLFRSLAEDQGSRTVGVVLSGTGSDGAAGVRAIKAAAGLTLAQDEESARYSGMPHAAAATGRVDVVLPPAEIAQELVRIVQHPHLRRPPEDREESAALGTPEALKKIFVLVRQATGVDFSQYKQSTVERRIARRLILHKLDSPHDYLRYLQRTPAEVHALFDDMLISVTSFFREPETFDVLKQKVFPQIVHDTGSDAPVRIWVPGCSTGEEAYSIAIALLEYLAEHDLDRPIQIFATDISEPSIERARHGYYAGNIAGDLSEARLRRHFTRSSEGYRISKTIRDLCVFARQDVLRDPPFSNVDLLSCRNLLIYLGAALQKRVMPTFHYALKPTGYLLLGRSETIGGFADLFSLVDRDQKIYAKKETATRLPPELGPLEPTPLPRGKPEPEVHRPVEGRDLERQADRLLANQYAPPGVIVNPELEIVHFRGETGRFLEHGPGAASLNLLRMARPGLTLDLRTAIYEARKQQRRVRREGLRTTANGNTVTVNIEVHPLGPVSPSHLDDLHFLVLFEEITRGAEQPSPPEQQDETSDAESAPLDSQEENEIDRLRRELRETRAAMQGIIEEHESTNEELRAANEEIQSANEELQSTNEELETAKEELQSTNEELITLNTELESQNAEANRAIDDFNNLHNAVNIPVILLDTELRIRNYTPPTERQLGVQPTDQGRRIGELRLGIQADDLEGSIREVLDSLNTHVQEVQTAGGGWYSLRIQPYRTSDDRITGAVLVLIDVTESHRARESLHNAQAQALAEGIVRAVRQPLVILDSELRAVTANPAFYGTFQVADSETLGRRLYELGDGQWDNPELRRLLDEIVPENTEFEGYEVVHDFPKIGRRRAVLDARRIEQQGDRPHLVLLTIRELKDL